MDSDEDDRGFKPEQTRKLYLHDNFITIRAHGLARIWHSASDRKIVGSNPTGPAFNHFASQKCPREVAWISLRPAEPYTWVRIPTGALYYTMLMPTWPSLDMAPASGAGDLGFESRWGHHL